jgi:hypothetical protein
MSTQISDEALLDFYEKMDNATEEEQKVIATEFYNKYVSV